MYYITPEDCIKILNVKCIEDIKLSMLWQIAEQEKLFAKNYYNEDSDRSLEQQEKCVVNGKFGELLTMISLTRSGYQIVNGVIFSDRASEFLYGDGGIDLMVAKDKINYKIQVKICKRKYLNFRVKRQKENIRKNLEDGIIVLICHYCCINHHWKYVIRKLDKTLFESNLKRSSFNDCKFYINAYDIQMLT